MIPDKIKEDFYNKYNYQRPDAEKNGWEAFWDNAVEWCKEHWQEIVTTVGIIVGAALAIAAVVMTGGAAVFCQVLFPEKSVGIPFFQQGIFPAFSGHYASLRMRACSIR